MQKEVIGNCELYLGDCMDIMPILGKVDAVVTDPPYGIDYGGQLKGKGDGRGGSDKNGWKSYDCPDWDKERPKENLFNMMLEISKHQIIWGGNYFADLLPPTQCWLVWNKGQRGFSLADGELAYTSMDKAVRIFDYSRGKMLAEEKRSHPTQKPIRLMKWCIDKLPDNCNLICDPFMGSGTTGVACQEMGRKFIGIEKDLQYFEIACKRIEESSRQKDLFL